MTYLGRQTDPPARFPKKKTDPKQRCCCIVLVVPKLVCDSVYSFWARSHGKRLASGFKDVLIPPSPLQCVYPKR